MHLGGEEKGAVESHWHNLHNRPTSFALPAGYRPHLGKRGR